MILYRMWASQSRTSGALGTVIFLLFLGTRQGFAACAFNSSGVTIVASPVLATVDNGTTSYRPLEVYWWGLDTGTGDDYFGLWTGPDPPEDLSAAVDVIPYSGLPEGHEVFGSSGVEFDATLIPDDVTTVEEGTCLPYWVGFVKDGSLVYTDCVKLHPHWMRELRDQNVFAGVNLTDMVMPGIHDAGAAFRYKNWTFDGTVEGVVSEWTFTHHNGIYENLVMGVRYLDMRIAYYNESEHLYYVNHGAVRIFPLHICLQEVKRFMSETSEIVVFDIHGLEHGFDTNEEALPGLVEIVESYLSPWMLPNTYQPTPSVNEIWETNDKRLIVTIPVTAPNDLYWNSVHHVWPDANNLEDFFDYFDEMIPLQDPKDGMWSAMAEFTENSVDVILDRWHGLTGAANITNFPVTLKLQREWWWQVNIVSMDFVLGSAVIDSAIEANNLKFACTDPAAEVPMPYPAWFYKVIRDFLGL